MCRLPGSNLAVAVFIAAMTMATPTRSFADEGGSSFWLPGPLGSLAAVQSEQGWSIPLVYYHSSSDANASKQFKVGGRIAAGLDARADLLLAVPTYVFGTPVAGGQATLSVTGMFGRVGVDTNSTLVGPPGGVLSGAQSDSVTGGGDLYPQASLKWNRGVHNFMAYAMAGVPVGAYQKDRLANLGLNHWSVDAGGAYTYLDLESGYEFTAALGFTYNFENPDTQYMSGIDGHLDWAASQFLSEQLHVGLVGYFYRQLTGDSGAGAVLGDFRSQVAAIGPQADHFFKVGARQCYVNLKGNYEFDAKNRPEGWNAWLTVGIPL